MIISLNILYGKAVSGLVPNAHKFIATVNISFEISDTKVLQLYIIYLFIYNNIWWAYERNITGSF